MRRYLFLNEFVESCDLEGAEQLCQLPLQNDPKLSKWDDELKLEIMTTLTSGSHGM